MSEKEMAMEARGCTWGTMVFVDDDDISESFLNTQPNNFLQ